MLTIGHIVNPFSPPSSSDLATAQPVVMETMLLAKEFSADRLSVELLTAQYAEDRHVIPSGFRLTDDLSRSVMDVAALEPPRKLPLIADILDRLHKESSAEMVVYTNMDIGLQPFFYDWISEMASMAIDAFVVNRRTIQREYESLKQIPRMWAEEGKRHPGWDCFVFPRAIIPDLRLGHICIGAPMVGRVLAANLLCHSHRFSLFNDKHVTFHIGEDPAWRSSPLRGYYEHNRSEAIPILNRLSAEHGPFLEEPGKSLFDIRAHVEPSSFGRVKRASRRLIRRARSRFTGRSG